MRQLGRCFSYLRAILRGFLFIAIFGAGLTTGLFLERHRQYAAPIPPPTTPPLHEMLLGKWMAEGDAGPMDFRPDGTYDAVMVTTLPMPPGIGLSNARPLGTQEIVSGLYRWLDEEHIEITLPKSVGGEKGQFRVIIHGDDLTLISESGEVMRGKRQR